VAAAAQQPGSNLMQVEPVAQSEDTWVTVFGFSPDDLALVLQVSRFKVVTLRFNALQCLCAFYMISVGSAAVVLA
jgi:hypothetical protein